MKGSAIAKCINILGAFCGKRDIPQLTQSALFNYYHLKKADVMVLIGGSILYGGDVFAGGMLRSVAKKYMIVGGAGHTTPILRQNMRFAYPNMSTDGMSEAELFAAYLKRKYDLTADYLERESTNCGNNITYCLDVLNQNDVSYRSIILMQDATMQRRIDAGFRKQLNDEVCIINYAPYLAEVVWKKDTLQYANEIPGMWGIEQYISLLLGEIVRLTDDKEGYGPNGRGFIAHVDIPEEVTLAFHELSRHYRDLTRTIIAT